MSFLRFLFNCFSYFILLTIHLFIFNAGPMLIAVFITEMVILHKYVYLLLLHTVEQYQQRTANENAGVYVGSSKPDLISQRNIVTWPNV